MIFKFYSELEIFGEFVINVDLWGKLGDFVVLVECRFFGGDLFGRE